MTLMVSFRAGEVDVAEADRWAERLRVERSELLRDGLASHLASVAAEADVAANDAQPFTSDEFALDATDWPQRRQQRKAAQVKKPSSLRGYYHSANEEIRMSTQNDERSNARAREQRLGFVSRPRFEDYREKFASYFTMERRNGILQVQMHTNGGSVMYGLPIHNAWSQLWMDVGNDPDNEVLIFGGTGDQWIAGFAPEMS